MISPVLVTGVTGRLGRLVVARLVDAACDVRVLARHQHDTLPQVVFFTGDLRRGEGIDQGVDFAPLMPWGVQLAGNFSKPLALAAFDRARQRYAGVIGDTRPMVIGRLLRSRGTRPFYQVRLPAPTRAVAEQLCSRIQRVGGACVAMPSA